MTAFPVVPDRSQALGTGKRMICMMLDPLVPAVPTFMGIWSRAFVQVSVRALSRSLEDRKVYALQGCGAKTGNNGNLMRKCLLCSSLLVSSRREFDGITAGTATHRPLKSVGQPGLFIVANSYSAAGFGGDLI
jgi:hypothetical protein